MAPHWSLIHLSVSPIAGPGSRWWRGTQTGTTLGEKSRCVGVGAEEKRTKARTHTALMVGGTRHRAQWSYVGHKKGLVRISQGDWWGVRLADTLNGPKLQHSTLTNRGRLFFNQLLSSNKFVPGMHRVLCSCSLPSAQAKVPYLYVTDLRHRSSAGSFYC